MDKERIIEGIIRQYLNGVFSTGISIVEYNEQRNLLTFTLDWCDCTLNRLLFNVQRVQQYFYPDAPEYKYCNQIEIDFQQIDNQLAFEITVDKIRLDDILKDVFGHAGFNNLINEWENNK